MYDVHIGEFKSLKKLFILANHRKGTVFIKIQITGSCNNPSWPVEGS